MKILGPDENYYHVRYGHGHGFNTEGPFYRQSDAENSIYLRLTEKLRRPMKSRTWAEILQNGTIIRRWERMEPEVWKEFPVG